MSEDQAVALLIFSMFCMVTWRLQKWMDKRSKPTELDQSFERERNKEK